MKLYHRTYHEREILAGGFKDSKGFYGISRECEGVWLSDVPLDINEGADGDTLLTVEIPEEVVAPYEWIEEDKTYREFLMPASIINSYGSARIVEEDEEDNLTRERWKRWGLA